MIATPSTKLKYKAKDALIDINHLTDYHLTILIAQEELSISIVNSKNNRCLLAEKHTFNKNNTALTSCEEIIEDHHLLKAGFWGQVTVAIANNNFTLVPNSLFEDENKEQYLALHNEIEDNQIVLSHQHKALGATSVFAIDKELVEWFKNNYPAKEVKFVHQTSAFIEGVLKNSTSSSAKSIYINCETNILTIIVLHNGNLEYCNNFSYSTPQDVVYYTLFVMNELFLSTESTPLVVWGDIDIKSPAYLNLYKFIRYINLGEKPKTLTYGYVFDEIEENALFNTYNIYHCE